MKVYLCYVVTYQNGVKERLVVAIFSEEKKAENYCKKWNIAAIEEGVDNTYFYREEELDRYTSCY